jgi:hypothetical protein
VPETLTRTTGAPAVARWSAAAKAAGSQRSNSSAGAISGDGRSQLSIAGVATILRDEK